jgi:hypothetical protein
LGLAGSKLLIIDHVGLSEPQQQTSTVRSSASRNKLQALSQFVTSPSQAFSLAPACIPSAAWAFKTMPKEILIIGGGVIGLSTAYYCAQRGHRVNVLNRGAETVAGCAYGNAGLILPNHFVPLAAPGMVALGLK